MKEVRVPLLDRYLIVDIECGTNNNKSAAADVQIPEKEIKVLGMKLLEKFLRKIWTGFLLSNDSGFLLSNDSVLVERGEEKISVPKNDHKKENMEKKHQNLKPPRPPKDQYYSFRIADHKLIQELSEIAVLKRARIERMKALIRIKNGKSTLSSPSSPSSSSSSSSSSNPWTLGITIIVCLLILWQASS